MATTYALLRNTLIWLAALAVPLQGLCTVSCACAIAGGVDAQSAERESGCCSEQVASVDSSCCGPSSQSGDAERCCCSQGNRTGSCCCGADCQCGQEKNPKPADSSPPINESTQKIASTLVSSSTIGWSFSPPSRKNYQGTTTHIHCVSAADRCAFLCRFTL
jgi:hypothetical protein